MRLRLLRTAVVANRRPCAMWGQSRVARAIESHVGVLWPMRDLRYRVSVQPPVAWLPSPVALRTACMVAFGAMLALASATRPVMCDETEPAASKQAAPAPKQPMATAPAPINQAKADAAAVEFFERHVRPLLVEHCSECHSGEEAEAGLRLDTPAAVTRGGESGPVVVPGQPEQSRLIEVVRYDSDIQMPPEEKLPDDKIALLIQWVRRGAIWPDPHPEKSSDAPPTSNDTALGPATYENTKQNHWAFQPIRRPEPPAVQNEQWPRTPIDRFVLARLEQAGLSPSPQADRRTLIRRLYFDLIGLPPTQAEIDAFVADTAPDALQRLVDALLASPHYGERWGRHWLDVARYADTKGYVFQAEPKYPYAYTYRDYVIRAFNNDLPYDQFVIEQIAADLLLEQQPPEQRRRESLAALGFLTLGRRFNNNIHDIIDDRIDVVCRGFMGLTVTCARCHDHKYDPVPTEDYYSLYGVFASSVEPKEMPLIASPKQSEAYQAYMQELAKRTAAVEQFMAENQRRMEHLLRSQVTHYLVHIVQGETDRLDDEAISFSADDLRPSILNRWKNYLAAHAKPDNPVFGLWARFAALPEETFAEQAAQLTNRLARLADNPSSASGGPNENAEAAKGPDGKEIDSLSKLNRLVRERFATEPPKNMTEVAQRYGALLSETYQQWRKLQDAATEPQPEASHEQAGQAASNDDGTSPQANKADKAETNRKAPERFADADREQLRQVLYGEHSPTRVAKEKLLALLDRAARNKLRDLQKAVDQWKAESPAAPPRAMVLVDREKPLEPRIFLRGNPRRLGPQVKRHFLSALCDPEKNTFQNGSGRLELARAIVSPDNPLTARVIVNRVWQHHFGYGIVRTPSDFGTRGEPPTHPELLDYLASTFMQEGWSLKRLHRRILLSAVYQQASVDRPDCAAKDPENRLLWKMNRRLLEFEPLRDAMLAASGELDLTVGGRSFKLTASNAPPRRTLYGFIDRQDLPNLLRVFNLASPDTSTAVRPTTIVPQQALFMMNSPFVVQRARGIVARCQLDADRAPTPDDVHRLFGVVLGRRATPKEVEAALQFVRSADASNSSSEPGHATSDADHAAPASSAQPSEAVQAEQQPPKQQQPKATSKPQGAEQETLSAWHRLAQALLMSNEFAFVD